MQRQSDIISSRAIGDVPITIVGAGSIGSFTVLALSKMGAKNIRVVDFDTLEEHNIPNQFYNTHDVGKLKVDALKEIIRDMTGSILETEGEKFDPKMLDCDDGVVIAATDNMVARKQIYEAIKADPDTTKRYIDARMASLSIEIYNIDPSAEEDRKLYEGKLFDDKDAIQVPCTARGIVYPVMTCASIISNILRNVVMERPMKRRYVIDYNNDIFSAEA